MEDIDVQRIALKPGDVLAIRVKGRLSMEVHDGIVRSMRRALDMAGKRDVPVIVVTDDISFAVISEES